MRHARITMDDQDTWHHCYNRIAGTSMDLPFQDTDKEQFVRFLKRVSRLYTVRVVSYQVMSNHFHLLVQAPVGLPSPEETCRRYTDFHGGRRMIEPNTPACRTWQTRCRDVSWFMRHLQQLFTAWYNRSKPLRRRGSLWADRYKNTILESGVAVWSCWNYIENNPVRAGMVRDAADYRFCSYGQWHQTGRHPYEDHVTALILPLMNSLFGISSIRELRDRMDEALAAKAERDAIKTSFSMTVHRRVRHWTSGLVIGSALYVRHVMSRHRNPESVTRHRLASSHQSADQPLYAWRRLRDANVM